MEDEDDVETRKLQNEIFYRACDECVRFNEARERERARNEPPPHLVAGPAYVPMVEEIKRITVEFDAIEEPEVFTKERYDKVRADAKAVGRAIHELGGMDLMLLTLELYVPKLRFLHKSFDEQFDGIGDWLA